MSQIITLALDGEAIPLKSLTVTPSVMFQDKDQSGQSSSTTVAEQGIKPKELKVTGIIPFTEHKALSRLFALAEAKENGQLKRYRVANLTAQAINFRIGTFTSTIDASKVDGKQAWQVNFTLREHLSVSEKRDERAANKIQVKKQTKQGGGVVEEEQEELTWFERHVLKPINDWIGPIEK
ncbi:hypothetical protein Xmau_02412 [Xenorhabdus mauleonii]|uniref:Phage protein n=1 Tax=Xenorhabdus mauleonii TaxID=351675 RepID=A0A1I3RD02_9GAMM|nr:hypothetical protein [Xenorhabdus mauleonii]PHM39812.1 hypothetical protein Xmau_02412 [Xenorhabdus mauleonii]SFJ43241.1 hypothetical protein SAMN05421680_10947 [Xenorhabdus mauleonii]